VILTSGSENSSSQRINDRELHQSHQSHQNQKKADISQSAHQTQAPLNALRTQPHHPNSFLSPIISFPRHIHFIFQNYKNHKKEIIFLQKTKNFKYTNQKQIVRERRQESHTSTRRKGRHKGKPIKRNITRALEYSPKKIFNTFQKSSQLLRAFQNHHPRQSSLPRA
jgi:hypothetical protein